MTSHSARFLHTATRLSPATASTAPGREPPRTARGARTRARLIVAARTVFERDGYLDARLVDIAAGAKTAAGSFYTYFANKEEIFDAVLEDMKEEMLHPHIREATDGDDPIAIIEAANRAYLAAYERNAKLMRVLEQVATIDDNVRELRRARGRAFAERNARSIRDLQERGVADPGIDPLLAAATLGSMVGRMAYSTYVMGEKWEREELVTTLTRLWVKRASHPRRRTPPSEASPARRSHAAALTVHPLRGGANPEAVVELANGPLGLEDLAGRALWQLIDSDEEVLDLLGREALLGPGPECGRVKAAWGRGASTAATFSP
ncbi:MAG TPA: TetR/AcrR family transcriptional regulator [Solirubrobacteraceae bacterium]|nr:TetR/AcrR family transcriptional regulator [Solirubrobacteraceae bacterium]